MAVALAGAAIGSLICTLAVSLLPPLRHPHEKLRGRRLTFDAPGGRHG